MNCDYCNKPFTPKSKRHKFCRNACRINSHREKHGIAKPDFLQGVTKKKYVRPNAIPTANFQIGNSNSEIEFVENSVLYYERTLSNANKGIFPLAMVSLAGLGAVSGKDSLQKLGLSILGGYVGHLIDQKRKDSLISDCKNNIARLKKTKSQLLTAKSVVDKLVINNKINYDGSKFQSIINSSSYKNLEIESIGIDKNSRWFYLFGDPQKNFILMLHGKPGNGKSTFALQFADYFKLKHGKVLFIASEQHGTNKALQDSLRRHTGSNIDIHTNKSEQTFESLKTSVNPYDLIILDSINSMKLTVEEFEKLRELHPTKAFLIVLQSTKDGRFKGGQEWAHNSDIVIEMENFNAKQTKSRYAAPATILIE